MAHVLCITSGLTGILHASFEVVHRLQAGGHRVTYLSWSPVGEAVEAQGVPFVSLPPFERDPVPHHPPPRSLAGRLGALAARWATRPARLRGGMAALRLDEVTRTIRSLGPDLVLADVETHDSILAAHALGVPLLLLTQFFSTWPETGMPPLSSSLVPGEDPGADPEAVRALWREAEQSVEAKRRRRLWRGHIDRGDVLRAYARRSGFSSGELVRTAFPPPLTYRSLPVLSMTLAELEFPQTVRPGLHYVGPMVQADRRDVRSDAEAASQVTEAIERSRQTGTRLIYCSVSSVDPGDAAFLRTLTRVLDRRRDWTLVIGLGGKIEPDDLGERPPNVTALRWTPQLHLLDAADASINHGGIHTINECLHFGVPMLVYSGKRYDQNGNAARVAYHGIGLRGDKDADTEADIERQIERVLTDPDIQEAMARFRAIYQQTRESDAIVRRVEAHLGT